MHEVLVNRLGGLSLPRKSVVRLTDRPDMTLDVYRGRKTTMQQQCNKVESTLDDNVCCPSHILISLCKAVYLALIVRFVLHVWLSDTGFLPNATGKTTI